MPHNSVKTQYHYDQFANHAKLPVISTFSVKDMLTYGNKYW